MLPFALHNIVKVKYKHRLRQRGAGRPRPPGFSYMDGTDKVEGDIFRALKCKMYFST